MAAKKKKKAAVKKVAKKAAPAASKAAKKKATKKPASLVGRKSTDASNAVGSPALFQLVGRAITDPVFATALLANPKMVVAEFELDAKTREEVLLLLSKPALVANSILELRGRIGRPSKEAI
jgi:hypothetical protein